MTELRKRTDPAPKKGTIVRPGQPDLRLVRQSLQTSEPLSKGRALPGMSPTGTERARAAPDAPGTMDNPLRRRAPPPTGLLTGWSPGNGDRGGCEPLSVWSAV